MIVVLIVNLKYFKITWEESLKEGLSRSGQPTVVSVEDCLIVLISGGGWEDTLRMWMVPFHELGAELDEEESGLITCKHVTVPSLPYPVHCNRDLQAGISQQQKQNGQKHILKRTLLLIPCYRHDSLHRGLLFLDIPPILLSAHEEGHNTVQTAILRLY